MSHGLDQTATCAADPSNLNAQAEALFPPRIRRDEPARLNTSRQRAGVRVSASGWEGSVFGSS